jgi:membrane-associated phospholipid phosphatase
MLSARAGLEWLERTALTLGLVIFFIAGYFGVGLSRNPADAGDLQTFLDDQIPFIARSVWIYLLIFPAALLPLFVVRCRRLFRRTALAYGVAIAVSLICFTAIPITAARLRPVTAMLELTKASDWAVSVLYSLDPPYNLFPSLHVSIAVLAAFSAWKAARLYGTVALSCLAFVIASTCTVKQHVVLDAVGGIVLGALAGALILWPYRPSDGLPPAYSWRGPSIYLVFLALVYTGFYLTYLSATPV